MGDLDGIEGRMQRAVRGLAHDLERIRAGGASVSMLDAIQVDHDGRRAPLVDVATVTVPDPRQIVIQPWDPRALRSIGAAISASRTGLTPTVDGRVIRLYVPAMTAERRRELVALVHARLERARVEIRAIRHEGLAAVRSAGRDGSIGVDATRRRTAVLQGLTDRAIADIDALGRSAEARLLRV